MIYLIRVFSLRENCFRNRTWGYYTEFQDAHNAVINNVTDIFEENYYNYCAIVQLNPGILAFPKREYWYFADYSNPENSPMVSPMGEYLSYTETQNSPLSKFEGERITLQLSGETIRISSKAKK